ncbi:O-antigen ligase [Tepidibacillus sp. HK-1]|uniref:O-antigen ligase family protein n=1 Tax=Tepidibacillus sp. HK-1 TaxID=1883407 RepID=UPI000852F937|nr:O-antigen ligase family protein [Tepidibacillus sp. HK-1]GBF12293.1 O-Antigen ligase [Tepidibacillus sp. HK-1]
MKNLHRLLWILAIYPWLDFGIRLGLPSFIGSVWDDLFLLLIIVAVWFEKRNEPRYVAIPKYVQWPFYTFLFFSIGSIIVNVVPLSVSIDAGRVIFEPMLFALLTLYTLDDEEMIDRFIQILVISTVLIAIAGIIQYIFKIDSVRWEHKKDAEQFRIVSIFSNPNALAGYFNMILSFTVASFLFLKDKKQKIFYFLATIPILIALLLTFSRSAWIAFFVMAIFFVFRWNKWWLLALPVVGAIIPFVMPESVINRFAKLFDPTYYQMSSEYGRIAFWMAAFEKIKENPIFGVGLGMFGDSVPQRHNIPFATWVDNHYIKLGAEMGILGAIAFIALILSIMLVAHIMYGKATEVKQKVYLMGIAGAIMTMAIENVTASILEALTDAVYFYAFIGMLFALHWKTKKKA